LRRTGLSVVPGYCDADTKCDTAARARCVRRWVKAQA